MDTLDFKVLFLQLWNESLTPDERKTHACMLLTGEAAEVQDIWKKAKFSNRPDKVPGIDMVHLAEEIGDTYFGLLAVMKEFDLDLEYCLGVTARKLEKRYE